MTAHARPLVFHETSVPLRLAIAAALVACLLSGWQQRYLAWAAIGLLSFPFLAVYRFEIDRLNRTIRIQKLWLGLKQSASFNDAFADLSNVREEINDSTLCILEFTDGRRYETTADYARIRSALA